MASSHTINHATRDDVPQIMAMIQELADYENASSSNKATVQTLTDTLCHASAPGEAPSGPGYAKTLILRIPQSSSNPASTNASHSYASPGGEVVGMALYFNNYSTWRAAPGIYLEDLYVRKEYRNRGYGKLLIRALAKETLRIGGKRLEWSCLKWNEPSLAFYRSLGAQEMTEWVGLRVDGEALEKLGSI
ncbi:Acetyltransferase (GNAT)-like protein 5 [Elsinoe fawcettii]|nr:Acetyltransferase (GNAT)-like protein 5 [Elsinoe fawcettii]